MQTYLGIDIGTYSIKIVLLKIGNEHDYTIEETIEQEILLLPEEDAKTAKIQALRTALSLLHDKL
jgi:Tfp pilus assembly PilM family ATPase